MNTGNNFGVGVALWALLGATVAWAQPSFPIERPAIKLGDAWTSRTVDGWNNRETGQFTVTVVGFEAEKVLVRSHALPSDQTQTQTYTADWQPCRSMQNSSELVCGGSLRFPLTADYKHSYQKLPRTNGMTYLDAKCEGKGFEKVKVPAGEFDAFKIECKGEWTRVFGGSFSGQYEETYWYAPDVRHRVKYVFNDRRSNGQPDTKLIVELTEFKPAP